MPKSIEVLYENGVLKPLSPLKLKEHVKLKITFEKEVSAVRATSGMFGGLDDRVIEAIAISPEFLPEES